MQKLAIGESRHKAKIESEDGKSEKIHLWSTYNDDVKHCTAFGEWVKKTYGEKKIEKMKDHVADYLNYRIEKGLSAWTIKLDASALGKLYCCSYVEFGINLPEKKRDNIKRSRGEIKDFSEKKHSEIVTFIKGTGCRKHEVAAVRKKDIYKVGKNVFVHVEQGKGGKSREVPVIREYAEMVLKIADRCAKENDKLFNKKISHTGQRLINIVRNTQKISIKGLPDQYKI